MKIKEEKLGNKRQNYLSWDEFFMGIAKLAGARSKDPSTQVGACIVDENNRVLAIGYNGTPNNFDDDAFPWDREGEDLETKYLYVIHAERNAIANGNRISLRGRRIYVDLFPCNECAKEIIQFGIKEVIYLSDKYADSKETIASKFLFDNSGVSYRQLGEEHQKVLKLSIKPDIPVEYLDE